MLPEIVQSPPVIWMFPPARVHPDIVPPYTPFGRTIRLTAGAAGVVTETCWKEAMPPPPEPPEPPSRNGAPVVKVPPVQKRVQLVGSEVWFPLFCHTLP